MIRQTVFWLAGVLLLTMVAGFGCDSGGDDSTDGGGDSDSDSDGDTDTDSDADSDTDSDADADTDPTEPPDAPLILEPTMGQKVATPVRVAGTGEARATLIVAILNGDLEIGGTVGSVGADGSFAISAEYDEPADGTELTVQVMLKNDIGMSDPAEVNVVHQPQTISGSVSQKDGSNMGTAVHVRLYSHATEALDDLQEKILPAVEEEIFPATAYSFRVGEGRYYVRAFRDSSGPDWGEPDGEPSIPSDAQAPGSSEVVIAGKNVTGIDLVLEEGRQDGYFQDFNAYTFNESAIARPPEYESPPESGNWVQGKGLCEGYHMTLSAWGRDDISQFSAPLVRRPDGTVVTLLDDGGCGSAFDNSSMSYDGDSKDGSFSYGWPDPTDADKGEYRFFVRDELLDFIHVVVDRLDVVTKLSRNAVLVSPTGASPAPLSSTLTWEAVEGAKAYYAYLDSYGADYRVESEALSEPSFKPEEPLPDNMFFNFDLRIYDSLLGHGEDYDATANSVGSNFITDSDGKSSITISGNIINKSGVSAPIRVEAISEGDHWNRESSVTVPEGATKYSLVMLRKETADEEVRLRAFIDADGSGDDDSPGNSMYGFDSRGLDATDDVELDIVFMPPLKLKSPEDGATGVGDTPKFSWDDYSDNAPDGPWSFALFAFNKDAEGNSDFPDIVWGMPNTVTTLDMAESSSSEDLYDVIYLFSCMQSEGSYADGKCTGGKPVNSAFDLKAGTLWEWGIVIVECDFADYTNNVDDNKNNVDDYTDCLGPALGQEGNFYVMSDSWYLSTD